jgi:Uma2 family endonuclease
MVTFHEFYGAVNDGEKADLIAGVIYRSRSDALSENKLTGLVAMLVDGFAASHNLSGAVLMHRYAFKLGEFDGIEPDVAYVTPARSHLVGEEFMDGGPDIAVEVASRDSRSRDYGEKRELYRSAGVSEYWIVDPLQRRVEFWRLQDGQYELAPLEHNRIFRSQVIPGLWLNLEWLLAKELPRAYHCLQEILGQPAK